MADTPPFGRALTVGTPLGLKPPALAAAISSPPRRAESRSCSEGTPRNSAVRCVCDDGAVVGTSKWSSSHREVAREAMRACPRWQACMALSRLRGMAPRATLRALPNIISSSRVVLAAGFVAARDPDARLGLVGIAAATDFLDG